ncbi:15776_t:CDS:10 [Funneliformis geosporum]|uniref:15776_t:CDS:1 n=1 Tax=Funneliformis geosporum TaxID=1117311 RepID=A0A9W4WVI0_9GLOM|nr:15776_t:CDS:10 [Funneliformis geosporum]
MDQIKVIDNIQEADVDSISSSAETVSNSATKKKFGESDLTLTKNDERTIKRTELIQNAANGSSSIKNPVYLEWHGVNFNIPKQNNENKKFWSLGSENEKSDIEFGNNFQSIIENIHGCANPGEILAVMGPSGCGKTTLLNLLGDRVGSKGVQGTIKMNGHKPTKNSKRFVAYCTQDDIFFPELTVRDTLGYTARLRLPRLMSRQDKLKQVENAMQLLHLTKVADSKIGDHRVRGISGGERKRVSIASELLTDPSVIFLDEPTSELAVKQRKTIVMVIHQPSSQVFDTFDKLMLMADGHMVYFGERAGIVNYLANQGFKCHPNFNPADYILELLNNNEIKKKLINAYAVQVRDEPTGKQIVEKYSHRTNNDDKSKDDNIINAPVKSEHRWEATFMQQLSILTERNFKQRKEEHITDRVGSIFFNNVFWSFHPLISAISAFALDLDMLSKERQSRSYRLLSYFLSKQIAELPLTLAHPVVFTIIVYWVSGLLPDFGIFVAYLFVILLSTLTAQSFGYFFGATLLNVQKSMIISTVFMLSTMLLGGFYVKNLPVALDWLKYLSFSKYAYGLLMQIQFNSPKAKFECALSSSIQTSLCKSENLQTDYIPGRLILESEKLNDLPWFVNLILLFGFGLVMRVLAYYSLQRNTKRRKR